jgi:hypothetical protein
MTFMADASHRFRFAQFERMVNFGGKSWWWSGAHYTHKLGTLSSPFFIKK